MEPAGPAYVLPELDYSGRTFTLISGSEYNVSLVEGEIGEPLNDAKWAMERTVEEAFGIEISEEVTDFWMMPQKIKRAIMAGDQSFDAVSMMDRYALEVALSNTLLSMNDIETVQLDQPWWGTDISSYLTIGGNLYFGVTSAQLSSFNKTTCVLWNVRLGESLDLAVPYEDVFAGTWTLDDFMAYSGMANRDLNGNGLWESTDQYTYTVSDVRSTASMFWQGAGLNIVSKDANDIPYVSAYDNEALFDLLNQVHGLLYSGENNLSAFKGVDPAIAFLDGRAMLCVGVFDVINRAREMEDDFAVLPMPKYDESQKNYISRTYDPTFHMIPTTQEDPLFAGAVLDALSCVAYYDLIPVYIDTTLKDKASRDDNSKKNIQLCFDTRSIDMGEAFMFDYFGDQSMYDKVMSSSQFKFASYLESVRSKADKKITNIVDKLTQEAE